MRAVRIAAFVLGACGIGGCALLTSFDGLTGSSATDASNVDVVQSAVDGSSTDSAIDCGTAENDPLNCGRCGHSCLGDPCVGNACQAVAITTGPSGNRGIDVDDTFIYFANKTTSSVNSIAKTATNGTPTALLTLPSPFVPENIRVDGAYIGVLNGGAGNGGPSAYRINKLSGGTPQSLDGCSIDGNSGLAFDSNNYYFANGRSGDVFMMPKTSAGGCATSMSSGQPAPTEVAVDSDAVYFTKLTAAGGQGGIGRIALDGGVLTSIAAADIAQAWGIVVDGDMLVVSTNDGRIVRLGKDGTSLTELANGQPTPLGVAVDDTNVYWANNASNEVWMVPKIGGTPTLIAGNQNEVVFVVVDATRIYWETDTAIMRIAK